METQTLPNDFKFDQTWHRFGEKKHLAVIGKILVNGKKIVTIWNHRTGEKQTFIDNQPHQISPLRQSGYASKKKIKHIPLQMDDSIFIPFLDASENLATVQKIVKVNGKYEKFFEKGKPAKDIYYAFPTIQKPNVVLIGEGYATCESVYQMLGSEYLVVCSATASNIPWTCQFFSQKYPNAKVIILGDNDERGLKTPFEAGFPAIFPEKKDPDAKVDWNDAFVENQEITTQDLKHKIDSLLHNDTFTQSTLPQERITFLGKNETHFYVFDNRQKIQKKYAIKSFNKNEAVDLFSLDYLFENFPNKTGSDFVFLKVLDYVLTQSQNAGYWDDSRIRRNGIWKIKNNTYFHDGQKLLKNNKLVELGSHDGFLFPKNEFPYLKITDEELSIDEKKELVELIQRLSWKHDYASMIALGWIVLAPLCGILPWRPHLWITGGFGSGKTTVKNILLERILKIFSVSLLETTPAGVRQMLNEYSIPFLLEETESDDFDSMQKLKFFVKQVSNASDAGSSKSVKGSSGGVHTEFEARFMASFCSIHVNLIAPQYRSRFSILELVENKHNGFSGAGGTEERFNKLIDGDFPDRFLKWRLNRIDLILENYHVFYLEMKKRFSSRFASQYGMTLSAFFTFAEDRKVNEKDVESILERTKDLKEVSDETSIKNESNCFETLFSKKIIDGGHSYSIGEIVERVYRPHKFSDSLERTDFLKKLLEVYGMKFTKDEALAICNSHSELKALFAGTPYISGWRQHLIRLPFCFDPKIKSQVWISGKNMSCIFLDLIKLFENEEQ